jgi:hypothetical protein
VVSWHKVVRARHKLFDGIGRGGSKRCAGGTNDLEHSDAGAMRVAVEQLRGTAVRQKAEALVKRGIADRVCERPLKGVFASDGNDGLIVLGARVGGWPRRICGTGRKLRETSSALWPCRRTPTAARRSWR